MQQGFGSAQEARAAPVDEEPGHTTTTGSPSRCVTSALSARGPVTGHEDSRSALPYQAEPSGFAVTKGEEERLEYLAWKSNNCTGFGKQIGVGRSERGWQISALFALTK